ncbi:MHYT domain-containing protein [Longispora sp. NPDC051575]|uniref:MHYT domain-containing protein n=1 Tax=Longispora sp. NPDC051575 TaxID=3154943 RepID=UPI003435B27C
MAEVQQFALGWVTPVAAYVIAVFGCGIGLVCTSNARHHPSMAGRQWWLVAGAFSIGCCGIWTMHFTAIVGFDVPGTDLRYDPAVTAGSALIAVLSVGIGLFIVGFGDASVWRILLGGVFTGLGVAAMHYTGMAAMRMGGTVSYDPAYYVASVVIAVAASTVALWFTLKIQRWASMAGAALIMGLAVVGMHYTGMFGIQVHLHRAAEVSGGVNRFVFIAPIVAIVGCTLFGLLFVPLDQNRKPATKPEPTRVA